MLERLKEIAREDAELAQTLVGIYAEQAPVSLADQKRLLAEEDAPALKQEAHTLKGVSLNLGFDSVALLCKQIEDLALAEEWAEVSKFLDRLEEETAKIVQEARAYTATL